MMIGTRRHQGAGLRAAPLARRFKGGGKGGAVPAPAPAAPTTADPAIEEARRKEVIAARMARGRAATLLTGGSGDETAAPVATKRLLGE